MMIASIGANSSDLATMMLTIEAADEVQVMADTRASRFTMRTIKCRLMNRTICEIVDCHLHLYKHRWAQIVLDSVRLGEDDRVGITSSRELASQLSRST